MTYLLKNIGACGWLNSNPDQTQLSARGPIQHRSFTRDTLIRKLELEVSLL